MPMFMVERDFAEKLHLDEESIRLIGDYEPLNEIKWINSFLSADKKKTYCLYEAASIEVLQKHATDLGLPVSAITAVEPITR